MECYNCGQKQCKTIYPKYKNRQFVQKMCLICGWKSYPIEVIKFEK